MGYCTVADIKSDFKGIEIEATGTSITVDEAQDIIDQTSAYIDGRIGIRYAVPVEDCAGSSAALILKTICLFFCAERVKNILEVKTGSTQHESDKKQAANFSRTPKDDLDRIVAGELLLADAPLLNSTGGVTSYNSENCIYAVIDTTKQQW